MGKAIELAFNEELAHWCGGKPVANHRFCLTNWMAMARKLLSLQLKDHTLLDTGSLSCGI
jgi:hypothetical protein